MSDWQVGDLAVCVSQEATPPPRLTVGAVYTVIDINADWLPDIGLVLAEVCAGDAWDGFCSLLFRKIAPDKREACEEEFVTLLKRSKRGVSA